MSTKKYFLIIIILCFGIINNNSLSYNQKCDHNDQECRKKEAVGADRKNELGPEKRNKFWKNSNLPFWSKLISAGNDNFPNTSLKKVRSYPMYFFELNKKNQIIDKKTKQVLKGNFFLIYENFFDFKPNAYLN
jgi:hypothetical protein